MSISISEKTAIVTGAGKGIGRGIAKLFAADGAKVLVVCRNQDEGNAVVKEIRASSGEATFFQADVRYKDQMQAMVDCAVTTYGRLDILCLNAGIYPTCLLEDLDVELWDATMDTNLKGVMFAIQASIPEFRKQKNGRIVITSSITGPRVGFPGLSAYSASKGGVTGLSTDSRLATSSLWRNRKCCRARHYRNGEPVRIGRRLCRQGCPVHTGGQTRHGRRYCSCVAFLCVR